MVKIGVYLLKLSPKMNARIRFYWNTLYHYDDHYTLLLSIVHRSMNGRQTTQIDN